jgi:hypothetical protein
VYAKPQHGSPASPRPASTLRNLCSLCDSALDRSPSFLLSNIQRSTFNFQPPVDTKSFPFISFADPHLLNPVVPYRYKNTGWGCLPSFHLPYTLPSSVSRKSCICHSYENCRGGHQQFPFWTSELRSPQRFKSLLPYLLTSLLRHSRPIAAQSLWCNNSQRHGISSPSGETTPLPPVSKITRADIGDCWSWVPFARRAWVQRSNAMSVLVLHRSAGWLERI